MQKKEKKWKHTRPCDYCQEHELPNCKHYRGGKTAHERGRRVRDDAA